MKTAMLKILGVALIVSPAIGFAQSRQGSKPTEAYYITKEDIDTVNKQPGVDRTIRVMDIGDQHFSVGIIHRGATGAAANAARGGAAAAGRAGGAAAAGRAGGAQPAAQACGETSGTPSGASGIAHHKQTEGYYIVSGGGEMVTGGHIINGRESAPNAEVTTTLNGPSCSGQIGGPGVVKRTVKVGDIIIIPADVPHGWSNIPDHVDYLSFRPSDDALTVGYVHPSLKQ
jgi:mannose-6-phosphate isomerase-like protein (cupin superfamily)